jgi:hypothetical protein
MSMVSLGLLQTRLQRRPEGYSKKPARASRTGGKKRREIIARGVVSLAIFLPERGSREFDLAEPIHQGEHGGGLSTTSLKQKKGKVV